ncbi:DUF1906 domain-containing protein [Nocardioides sp.]|uniref:DUF1906 domain-containing protein n=1 Tax=Nocardioides sp. TaxID=35761 RepID=UPI002615B76B|nr:DUF1906 domain-containing protein [Nocardioides sp.]
MLRNLTLALGLALGLAAATPAAHAADTIGAPTPRAAARTATPPAAGNVLMLDTASTPSLTKIQAWQQSSPYKAIAVYIPVAPAYDVRYDKVQSELTADWVRQVRAGGWQVLPIYVGMQAPCSKYSTTFSGAVATARAQGAAMASDAANAAFSLGLPVGAPITYDLEAYPTDNATCRNAVQAMQDGWTRRLHQLGRNSGIYGSVSSTITHIVAASQVDAYAKPDAVWVAKWDGQADTTLATALPAGSWAGRRMHQFLGGGSETYGNVTLNIDASAVQPSVFTLPKPDITAPTLAVPAARSTTRSKATLIWTMRDPSGIARYQVQIRTGKRWTSPGALKRTTKTRYRVPVPAGATSCARVRGTDKVGNTSAWLTTCVYRWGYGKTFHGKGWKRSGTSLVSKKKGLATGPKVSGRTIAVLTRGHVSGQILLGGHVVGTFTRGGTHTVTLPRSTSGRLAIRQTGRGKLTVVRYIALP